MAVHVGLDVIRKATVTLTNAQIKALPTTPIDIVAAPGSGKILVPLCLNGQQYT